MNAWATCDMSSRAVPPEKPGALRGGHQTDHLVALPSGRGPRVLGAAAGDLPDARAALGGASRGRGCGSCGDGLRALAVPVALRAVTVALVAVPVTVALTVAGLAVPVAGVQPLVGGGHALGTSGGLFGTALGVGGHLIGEVRQGLQPVHLGVGHVGRVGLADAGGLVVGRVERRLDLGRLHARELFGGRQRGGRVGVAALAVPGAVVALDHGHAQRAGPAATAGNDLVCGGLDAGRDGSLHGSASPG